jgi:hypothetical protein
MATLKMGYAPSMKRIISAVRKFFTKKKTPPMINGRPAVRGKLIINAGEEPDYWC